MTRSGTHHRHWWQHRTPPGDTLVEEDRAVGTDDDGRAVTRTVTRADTTTDDDVDVREARRAEPAPSVEPDPRVEPAPPVEQSRVDRRQYAMPAPAATREEVVAPATVPVPVESYRTGPYWGVERLGAMAIGAFFVVMGVLTFARGDLNGSWYRPVVDVFSFNHTPAVGGLEVIAGALLLLSTLSSRTAGLAAIVGILTIAAGALVIAGEDPAKLHTEDNFGWLVAALGAGAVLFAAPGLGLRRREVRREYVRTPS